MFNLILSFFVVAFEEPWSLKNLEIYLENVNIFLASFKPVFIQFPGQLRKQLHLTKQGRGKKSSKDGKN